MEDMTFNPERRTPTAPHTRLHVRVIALFLILWTAFLPSRSSGADGPSWTFKSESVDASGKFSSVKVDAQGNVHLSYTIEGDHVKYGFRDVANGKWWIIDLDAQASFTSLALDSNGNPSVCYTQRTLRYAHWNGKLWQKEEVSPGAGAIANIICVV